MKPLTWAEQMARLEPSVVEPRTAGPGWILCCTRRGCDATVIAKTATDAHSAENAASLRGWPVGDYAIACPEHGEDAAL